MVSCPFTTLFLEKLQYVLAIELRVNYSAKELIMAEQSIRALCATLINVDPSTDAVSVVHYTVHDYFEEKL